MPKPPALETVITLSFLREPQSQQLLERLDTARGQNGIQLDSWMLLSLRSALGRIDPAYTRIAALPQTAVMNSGWPWLVYVLVD